MVTLASKNITVKGYLAHNLGDDLFMDTLFRRYPDVCFTVVADGQYRFFEQRYGNVRLIPLGSVSAQQRLLRLKARLCGTSISEEICLLLRDIRRSHTLVMIGGSMYQQQRDERLQRQILFETRHLYRGALHAFVIGANFGPYWSEWYREEYQKIFTRYCDDVCFRDRWSGEQFLNTPKIRTASDVLFTFPMPKKRREKQVFLSVCDLSLSGRPTALQKRTAEYEQWLVDISSGLCKRGYKIIFGAFCAAENDVAAIERVRNTLVNRGIESECLIYSEDSAPIVNVIASSEIVVSTRFHATILGLVAGAKVLPVIYNVKTDNMLNDLDIDIPRVDLLKSDSNEWISDIDSIVALEPIDVDKQIADAQHQFDALDAFLGRATS